MNAYKHYIDRATDNIKMVATDAEPVLRNSLSESMNLFVEDMEKKFHAHFNSQDLKKEEVMDAVA